MPISFYNTLSRKIEEFKPINAKEVLLYTCGPTVYNYPHIGNYRAYIFADILKRTLIYCGYNVKHIMNITDIDDKTIRDSQKEGKSLKEFTEFYTNEFFADIDNLGILRAEKYTKATDYINEMVSIIETLIEKGFAYKSEDGSVYFDIKKDSGYGKLSHFTVADLKENAKGRMASDEYDKDNAQDFALWKAWDENDGDNFWQTSLGKGRPGWHIECSAMSMANLGETLDIHTGGVDNIFPHHENEIAQSECATGQDFVHYFMHNEHLLVNGAKMAKSAGNFYTLRDLQDRDFDPIAFRYWLYTAHYRTKTNFTFEALTASQTALYKLYDIYREIKDLETGVIDEGYNIKFQLFIENDLDMPKALALMWEVAKDSAMKKEDKKATMLAFDKVFGFGLANLKDEEELPSEVLELIDERNAARENKDYAMSDLLRAKIEALGYEVKDTDVGTKVKRTKIPL